MAQVHQDLVNVLNNANDKAIENINLVINARLASAMIFCSLIDNQRKRVRTLKLFMRDTFNSLFSQSAYNLATFFYDKPTRWQRFKNSIRGLLSLVK